MPNIAAAIRVGPVDILAPLNALQPRARHRLGDPAVIVATFRDRDTRLPVTATGAHIDLTRPDQLTVTLEGGDLATLEPGVVTGSAVLDRAGEWVISVRIGSPLVLVASLRVVVVADAEHPEPEPDGEPIFLADGTPLLLPDGRPCTT